MDQSVFLDKNAPPSDKELESTLGPARQLWVQLVAFILDRCPQSIEEWNYSKFGWNFKIKDKKRAIAYFMPCKRHFKLSLVLGKKAVADALGSNISPQLRDTITNAHTYAEGTGIRIDVKNKTMLKDLKLLIELKLKY